MIGAFIGSYTQMNKPTKQQPIIFMTDIPLSTCLMCSHQYSSSASSCPSCGTEKGTAICPHCGNIVIEGDTCYCNAEAPYDDTQLKEVPYEEDVPTVYEDPYSSSYDTPFELPYDNSYIAAQDSSTDIAPMFMLEDDTDYVEEDCTPYETEEDTTGPEPENTEYCPCQGSSGSSQSDMGSVDFSINFGQFPSFPGISSGRLSLHSTMLDSNLWEQKNLRYEHVSQRFVNAIQSNSNSDVHISTVTEKGYSRVQNISQSEGAIYCAPKGLSQSKKERLRFVDSAGNIVFQISAAAYIEEVLGDGTILHFQKTLGFLEEIITPEGLRISREQLNNELKIIRFSEIRGKYMCNSILEAADSVLHAPRSHDNIITQIWNKTDGLLSINLNPDASYTIKWFSPEQIIDRPDEDSLFGIVANATPIKTWTISAERDETALLKNLDSFQRSQCYYSGSTNLKYLSALSIKEQRGERTFHSRWEQHGCDRLLFTKGTGPEAEQCLKVRVPLKYANTSPPQYVGDIAANDSPNSHKEVCDDTGYVVAIGNIIVSEFENLKTHFKGDRTMTEFLDSNPSPVFEKYSIEKFHRYEFGDSLIKCTEKSSINPNNEEITNFHYDTNSSSDNYGSLIWEEKSNGINIFYKYDKNKRLLVRTETCDNFKKITYNAYCNIEFNDRRIARTDEFLEINGVRRHIATTQYIYEKSPALVRHTTKHMAHLSAEQPEVSFTEWYGVDMSLNGAHSSHAIGRIKRERRIDGLEVLYTYHDSEEEGIAYICRQTQCYEGLSFPNSKQTSLFYNAQGDIVKRQERAHI